MLGCGYLTRPSLPPANFLLIATERVTYLVVYGGERDGRNRAIDQRGGQGPVCPRWTIGVHVHAQHGSPAYPLPLATSLLLV